MFYRLADRLTGLDFSQQLVDDLTLYGLVAAFIASISLNTAGIVKKKIRKY